MPWSFKCHLQKERQRKRVREIYLANTQVILRRLFRHSHFVLYDQYGILVYPLHLINLVICEVCCLLAAVHELALLRCLALNSDNLRWRTFTKCTTKGHVHPASLSSQIILRRLSPVVTMDRFQGFATFCVSHPELIAQYTRYIKNLLHDLGNLYSRYIFLCTSAIPNRLHLRQTIKTALSQENLMLIFYEKRFRFNQDLHI